MFATKKLNDNLMKVSEHLSTRPEFKGLKLDDTMTLRTDTRETVSLKKFKAVMLSKGDFTEAEEYRKKYLDDKLQRFLDGESIAGDRIVYQTWPRSGNTFLRKYIEMISGVPSGSDLHIMMPLNMQLMGLVGEQACDDTVWIVKSHHPQRWRSIDFPINKYLICVRNPFDTLASQVTFYMTKTQSKEMVNKPHLEEPEWYDRYIRYSVKGFKKFQDCIMK